MVCLGLDSCDSGTEYLPVSVGKHSKGSTGYSAAGENSENSEGAGLAVSSAQ